MSEIIDELLADAGERMHKSVESTNHEFASVRTGRASPALLDRVVVDYYGVATPLKQLATIGAPEATLLSVQPYDQSSIKAIEKGILESDPDAVCSGCGDHFADADVMEHVPGFVTDAERGTEAVVSRSCSAAGRCSFAGGSTGECH